MNAKILIQGKNLKGIQITLHIFMKLESLINKEISKDTYSLLHTYNNTNIDVYEG